MCHAFKRTILSAGSNAIKEDLLADMEIRLAKEKSEQGIDNAMYLRQYGYKIHTMHFVSRNSGRITILFT